MKKALIFYGGWDGHTPKETAHLFAEILREEGFETVMADTLSVLDDFESIKGYDLFVPVWTMGEISWEQENNICRAVEEGAGIAGCHGGMCDSFRESTEWQFMTGSQWVSHPGGDQAVYTVKLDKDAPLTCGLEDITLQSEQYYIHVDPAVQVWATTKFPVFPGPHDANGEIDLPVVYTKFWGKGKVYYNSLGHTYKVFRDIPQAYELMRRGFLWAAR
jgi:type 1 glutamine amidotransferase